MHEITGDFVNTSGRFAMVAGRFNQFLTDRLVAGAEDTLVRHGIPTVTFGAGQNEVHTVNEWIDVSEYQRACALAVMLATMQG